MVSVYELRAPGKFPRTGLSFPPFTEENGQSGAVPLGFLRWPCAYEPGLNCLLLSLLGVESSHARGHTQSVTEDTSQQGEDLSNRETSP